MYLYYTFSSDALGESAARVVKVSSIHLGPLLKWCILHIYVKKLPLTSMYYDATQNETSRNVKKIKSPSAYQR